MSRPIIGLIPLVDEDRESLWMLPGYMDGIIEAGGTPVMLPLTDDEEMLQQMVAMCNGFLFTGGHDVSPTLYGEDRISECGVCCEIRDSMEKKLLEMSLNENKAILGICRGIQFINAVLGGSLYQDLPTQKPSELEHHQMPPYDQPIHHVTIVENTPLYDLLQSRDISVNSYHHQAIKELAPDLRAMAYSTDELVEAVYMPEKRFVWAVQWHPEFAYKSDVNSKLILKKFVEYSNHKR